MVSKIKFDEYAKRVTYRRLGLVLIPVVGSLLFMIGYFAFQITSGQQRKVVGALSRNIAANVINGDSFQLKSLVVSAVKSGLFGGIEIRTQGQVISGFGEITEPNTIVPIVFSKNGIAIAQSIPLDDVSDSWVVVSTRFSWIQVLTVLSILMGALALIIFGSVWVSSRLAHELALPLTELAKAISAAKRDDHQPTPIGGHFAEVSEVWTRHVSVISHLRSFLEKEAETKKDIAVARTAENLAHDIKNPLIAFDFALRARNWEEYVSLRGQMTRSLTTIRTILGGFGKSAEPLMIKPALGQLDLATLAGDLKRIYGNDKTSVTLKGQRTISAFVDAIAVERAIGNLVKNAVEAGATFVEIASSFTDDTDITLKISDNGPGVPVAIQSRLFSRGTTHGKKNGSGIGLHNVRAIAEGHGGSVRYSREDDLSTFTVFLPKAVATWMESQESLSSKAVEIPMDRINVSHPPKSIFIGIKDENRRNALTDSVVKLGFTVSELSTAAFVLLPEDSDNLDSFLLRGVRVVLDDPDNNPQKIATFVARLFESIKRANTGAAPI